LAPTLNNPAARLFALINSISQLKQGMNLMTAWGIVLNVSRPGPDNSFVFLRRYGKVLALPKRAREALLNVRPELSRDLYFRWIPKLEAALLGPGLTADVSGFNSTFDKSALDNLEFCADLLSRQCPEKTIENQALAKIVKEAQQLRQDTVGAEIDEGLRSYILDGLDDITSAIEDYDLEGIASVERGVERAFGRILVKNDQAARLRGQSVWKRFGGLLSTLALVVSAANGAVQLPHNVHEFLIEHDAVERPQLTFQGQGPALIEIQVEPGETTPTSPARNGDGTDPSSAPKSV